MVEILNQFLRGGASAQTIREALSRVAPEANIQQLESLADMLAAFIGSMPQAIAVAYCIGRQPACRRAVAFGTGQVLHYLFDEQDLLPEADFGVLGLLDDAYLAHSYAATLAHTYPFVDLTAAGYAPPDQRATQVVRALLPAGVADALDRTCRDLAQVAHALFASVSADASAEPSLPELRMSDAIAALQAAAPGAVTSSSR